MVTSLNSTGSSPAELSSVRLTSARPSAGRFSVPAKMTSSIFWERTDLGACAPSTQAIASTTFDLPEPLGPTTTVTPGSSDMTRRVGERLEALEGETLQEHGGPESTPAQSFRHRSPAPSSRLAAGAEVGGPLRRHRPADPADATGAAPLPGPAVHRVVVLVRAALAATGRRTGRRPGSSRRRRSLRRRMSMDRVVQSSFRRESTSSSDSRSGRRRASCRISSA